MSKRQPRRAEAEGREGQQAAAVGSDPASAAPPAPRATGPRIVGVVRLNKERFGPGSETAFLAALDALTPEEKARAVANVTLQRAVVGPGFAEEEAPTERPKGAAAAAAPAAPAEGA